MTIKRSDRTVLTLTEEQERAAGEMLVKIFQLRKDREAPGRYHTTWGNKTPLGVYRTMRYAIEIAESGELLPQR